MKIIKGRYLIFLMIVFNTSSCIESFIPDIKGYEDVLCIEAQLTNDPSITPYVLISKTIPVLSQASEFGSRKPDLISGAVIRLMCDDGNTYNYRESEPGKYIPEDELFIGETGKAYKISIFVNGHEFESDFQLLNESPAIDGFTSEAVSQKSSDDGRVIEGLRFFVSNHNDRMKESYYRWILDATFKYNVPLNSDFIYLDGLYILYQNNEIAECYKDKKIGGIYISGTAGLEENRIIDAPLNFESQYGDELSMLYCLHAKQLIISESAYNFWFDLNKLINETGGLYETIPFQMSSNIECVSSPTQKVAGVFEVAGVSEGREYFIRPVEFDILRWKCLPVQVGTEELPWDKLWDGAFLYEGEPGIFFTSENYCFDCRERGGVVEKPPFWEY